MGTTDDTSSTGRVGRVRRRLSPPDLREIDSPAIGERLAALTSAPESPQIRNHIEQLELAGGFSVSDLRPSFPTVSTPRSIDTGRLRGHIPPSRPGFSLDRDVLGRVPAFSSQNPLQDSFLPPRPSRPTMTPRLDTSVVQSRFSAPKVDDVSDSVPSPQRLLYGETDGVPDRDSPTTTPEYFVGVVPQPHSEVVSMLEDCPLQRSYVTHPKVLSDDEFDVHQSAASIWVYRPWSLSHFQWHVPLFELESEDAVHVFFHHEYNWLRHPAEHLDADYLNPEWGRDRVLDLFETAGIHIEPCCSVNSESHELAAAYCTCGGAA